MKTNEMKVLTVGGTPRERGRAIGESLREDIHAVMEKHEQAIDKRPGYSVKEYYTAFDQFGAYLDAVKKWAPDLLEEVWGMAEGANIEPYRMFRFQLIDEERWLNTGPGLMVSGFAIPTIPWQMMTRTGLRNSPSQSLAAQGRVMQTPVHAWPPWRQGQSTGKAPLGSMISRLPCAPGMIRTIRFAVTTRRIPRLVLSPIQPVR
jgi:hypothetical protein